MKFRFIASLVAALSVMSSAAFAQGGFPLITIDENGTGLIQFGNGPVGFLNSAIVADPGPGGLGATLTYDMGGPPSVTAGDLFLQDGVGGPILDVVRFNDYNTGGVNGYPASIVFYSDNTDGLDSIGDTASPPGAFYANTLTIQEVGNEGLDGAIYTPLAGQPGYVPGFGVTYDIISDGQLVPEPSSVVLFAVGIIGMGALMVVRRRRNMVA